MAAATTSQRDLWWLNLPTAWAAFGSAIRRASWRFWTAIGCVYSVRAMAFKWGPSWRFTDEDQRFGSGVNLGWSNLIMDVSTISLLSMTSCCTESLESWKQPTVIYGSTVFLGSSTSARRKFRRP